MNEKVVARDTGDAAVVAGVANTGVITGSVTVTGRPVARSVYRRQALRIMPDRLFDREAELARLVEFCAAADGPSYSWLRAPAWAGKSALMASLAAAPPGGVRIVPFFVTSRWAEQNDHVAFTDVVTEQLAELLSEPVPEAMPATRGLVFDDLLERAAALCVSRGERLVLLVDGLDEDRGVVAGPNAHSIAALLPAPTPPGLRVLVSGRPSPPIPSDVPARHPLRDKAIVWDLTPSRLAQVVREDMLRELDAALYGAPIERDLVGLVTSARGGLSTRDIGELTGLSTHEVHRHLNTVAGRTFMGRPSHWFDHDVYVLGHEDLQVAATEQLGADELARYRQKLHQWADGYREKGWPTDTPEYLLRGYFRLLQQERDLDRMLGCGTDTARHDRMLDLTGGDSVALAEIAAASDAFTALDPPDLVAVSRLAVHYDSLSRRNADIPPELAVVWAAVGHTVRAENLADSMTDPADRVLALVQIARQAHTSHHTVDDLLRRALTTTRSIREPGKRTWALTTVATALAEVERPGDARQVLDEATANGFPEPWVQPFLATAAASLGDPTLVVELARRLDDQQLFAVAAARRAQAGDTRQADEFLDHIALPDQKVWAAGMVAEGFAAAHDWERAIAAVDAAEAGAMLVSDEPSRSHMFGQLARVCALAGDPARAEQLIDKAATTAGNVSSDHRHGPLARAAAAVGRWDEAVRIATSMSGSAVPAELAKDAAKAGRIELADELAAGISDTKARLAVTASLARIAADAGDRERAIALADAIETTARSAAAHFAKPDTLAAVITALATTGHVSDAAALATSIPEQRHRNRALAAVAGAAPAEHRDTAAALARSIDDPDDAARALADVAMTAATAGDLADAIALAEEAVTMAAALDPSFDQIGQLPAFGLAARTYAVAGQPDRAVATTNLLTNETFRETVRTTVATAAAQAGRYADAVAIARTATVKRDRLYTLAIIASTAVDTRDLDVARDIVADLAPPLGWAADELARTYTALGEQAQALAIVDHLESTARAKTEPRWHDEGLIDAARAFVHAGGATNLLARFPEIIPLAEDTSGPRWRQGLQHAARRVLAAAALWHAKRGEIDKILALTNTIGPVREHLGMTGVGLPQADAQAAAALALAESAGIDQALDLARSISDPTRRATAVTAIATHAGAPANRALVAEAIRTGGVVPCLPALAAVDPDAVVAVADEATRLIHII
ncbi:hypothetical protein [Labedaea rhizosphaerae]|uniref:NACHT domain-containing protein n=1 Tax=Labedaea rhizosphaerae TaxID=598644 RepID=A0A4R6SII0_LABRH|nr:hypothetical protein [Labedaea rhizosphaerae]TDQ00689.1 hypothetical protein EV186_102551 [Labedaea rhizosphaerae]